MAKGAAKEGVWIDDIRSWTKLDNYEKIKRLAEEKD